MCHNVEVWVTCSYTCNHVYTIPAIFQCRDKTVTRGLEFIAELEIDDGGKNKELTLLITSNHVLPSLSIRCHEIRHIFWKSWWQKSGDINQREERFGKFFKTDDMKVSFNLCLQCSKLHIQLVYIAISACALSCSLGYEEIWLHCCGSEQDCHGKEVEWSAWATPTGNVCRIDEEGRLAELARSKWHDLYCALPKGEELCLKVHLVLSLCHRPLHWAHCHHTWWILWEPSAETAQQWLDCGRSPLWCSDRADELCYSYHCGCWWYPRKGVHRQK